jgi:protein-S-isoprenylcysteine O-methyltransferase Ste14
LGARKGTGVMNSLYTKGIRSTLIGAVGMAVVILGIAGTLHYWRGWAFMAVFELSSIACGIYLAVYDRALLERRMKAGPAAEKETVQKIIITLLMISFVALIVISVLDFRLGWSNVSPLVSVAGDALIALGFLVVFFVLRANSYSASTIQIAEGQTVISTGPYALVRHPMYAGALSMMIGTPLALGSWWGLTVIAISLPILVWRLLDEERFLKKNLPGYANYTRNVPYRLAPYIW